MKKLIDRFTAIDSTGNKYTISCYQEFRTYKSLSGQSRPVPGIKEYRCELGAVNMIDDNNFEIVATQTEIKKVT